MSSQSFTGNTYIRLPNGMTVCDIGAVTFLSKTSGSERIVSSLPIAPSLIVSNKSKFKLINKLLHKNSWPSLCC